MWSCEVRVREVFKRDVFETIDDDMMMMRSTTRAALVNLFSRADFLLLLPFHPRSLFSLFSKRNRSNVKQRKTTAFDNMQSSDLMLVGDYPVPRDPAVLYEGMRRAGLQYGPSFRLLSGFGFRENAFGAVSCGRRRKRGSGR